jgi:WD40 repeat protein/uncharacterized caspase-like protein
MNSKSVPDRLPSYSFRRLVHKTAPSALRAFGALWLASFCAAAPQPQAAPPTTIRQAGKLELHHPVGRDLGPGQADLFTVDATAGQFLRVVADQKGVNVLLRIVDPEGKVLVTANRPTNGFGPQAMSAIVPGSGSLQLKVEIAPDTYVAGQYAMELTDLRDPTEKDRLRIDAETKLFAAIAEGRVADAANRRKAIEYYAEAASLWRDLQDGYEQALCLHRIGLLYSNLGENRKALDYYQQALPIRHALGDRPGESATLNNMAIVYQSLGDKQRALEYFQEVLALDRSVGNRALEASALSNVGNAYWDLGEKQKALEYFSQTLPLYRAMGNGAGELSMLNTIGRLYADLGEKQKALDSYTQALSLSRSALHKFPGYESATLGNLNSLYKLPALSTSAPAGGQPTPRPSAADTQVQLMAQAGPESGVSAIAFSPDGRFVLTASREYAAILWSVDEGKEVRRFEEYPPREITSVAFLPDGNSVVTGDDKGTVRIWDLHTGQELQRLTDSMPIGAISISPKGDLIATARGSIGGLNSFITGSFDWFSVHLWDRQSGKNIRSFEGHTGSVCAVAFSPDGKWLATASDDHTARLWDVATGKEVHRLTGQESTVNAIAFSPDGTLLATGSGTSDFDLRMASTMNPNQDAPKAEHTIRLWNVSSGTEIKRIDAPATILALAFSSDGRHLASGGGNSNRVSNSCTGCEVRWLDVPSGQEVNRIAAGWEHLPPTPVGAIAFSPNRMLLARSDFIQVVITSTDSGKEVSRLRGYSPPIASLRVSPDNRFIATRGPAGALWDYQTGHPDPVFPKQNPGTVSSIPGVVTQAYSPDGLSLLVDTAQQLCLVEASTGAKVRCLQDSSGVSFSAFSLPAGDAIIAISQTAPANGQATVRVWDTRTGAQLRSFQVGSGPAAVSPEVIAIAGNNSTCLYSWRTGELLRELYTGTERAGSFMSFSPDGRWLALASFTSFNASIWDTSTGQEKWEFPLFGVPTDVKFSSDGRFVFTAGFTGITSVWDFATGKQACSLISFDDGSWAVTDPDGRYDASNPDRAIGLHWVAGTEVIELGQLKQRFYTPNLFARVLKGEKLPDVASIQTIKLFPALDVPPLAPGSTQLNLNLTNRGGGIGRVVVRVNGKELPSDARGSSIDPNAPAAQLSIDLAGAIRAADGHNDVEVLVYDENHLVSSRGVHVVWTTVATPAAKPPRLFTVVAGVSEYGIPALHLNYPAKDAESMAQALRLAGNGLFSPEQVELHLLTTSGRPGTVLPTKDELRKAFESIVGKAEPQDVLVIYLAGHGVARLGVADQYYFLTTSARSTELPANDPDMLDKATISSKELKDWCLKIKALKQVIILDTCAAGAFDPQMLKLSQGRNLSPDQVRAMELLKDSTGSHILMGSAADKVSYEASRYGDGLLTYALLQGMHGEALDKGNQVDVVTLFNFVSRRVVELASGIGGIQHPLVSSGGQSFDIGLLSDEDKRAIPLANPKPQLMQVRCHDDQDGDSLGLAQRVRDLLKESSQPMTRGSAGSEPALAYSDDVPDGIPSAMSPRVTYQVQGGKLEATIRLYRDKTKVSEDTLTLDADPAAAARQIAGAIIEAATRAGPQ